MPGKWNPPERDIEISEAVALAEEGRRLLLLLSVAYLRPSSEHYLIFTGERREREDTTLAFGREGEV